jgi:hypothetical protein
MATTLVTALYNIGRDNMKGTCSYRKFDKYLAWFKHVLSINCPLVVFIPSYLQEYVTTHRPANYPMKIIIREFEQLEFYRFRARTQQVIDHMRAQPNAPKHYWRCPEFENASYQTIIFSKFDFLLDTAKHNPYNSKYFMWIDAGCYYDNPPFDTTLPWPDPYKIHILNNDQFLVVNEILNLEDTGIWDNREDYLKRNDNRMCAYFMGGTAAAIGKVHKRINKLYEWALGKGVTNNEQHFLQLLMVKYRKDFLVYPRMRAKYPNQPRTTRDRMAPAELSTGTLLPIPYAINEELLVLTLATREIPENKYKYWLDSAHYFGYNCQVVGRENMWQGFGCKISLYYQAVQNTSSKYICLTDCTDLFFTGSSWEMMDKYRKHEGKIIIGGEEEIWYLKGMYPKEDVNKFFVDRAQTAHCYPNSGYLLGSRENILKLLQAHISYSDDQGACYDSMYTQRLPLAIDYYTELVGNVPHYPHNPSLGSYTWEYDPNMSRYRNRELGTYPCVLHFPGKNWPYYHMMYQQALGEVVPKSENNNGALVIFVLIILLILLILALSRMKRR